MTMPNFFIVGAQKAGTTSLYHYLNQHPQVYMSPIKEPFFFDHEMDSKGEVVRCEFGGHRQPPRFTNIEEYSALFEGVRGEKAIGEATPLYIYQGQSRSPFCAIPPTGRIRLSYTLSVLG
jgi:hypothetical protein